MVAAEKQLHARLNWGASVAGDFFNDGTLIGMSTQRTGGEDKPDAPEAPPEG
uniref:Uncharacterized protein n=1 Tax=Caulobacter phage BL57 TaxID=3348355 RepID=A0AB74UH64_9VIRU